jgi:Cu/Ag efflux pump CusA
MSNSQHGTQALLNKPSAVRFFTETRHIAWVLFVVTLLWGAYSYRAMPKRKDPEIAVRRAVAICAWPGVSAERIEQQVVRKLEARLALNRASKRSKPSRATARPSSTCRSTKRSKTSAGNSTTFA